MKRTPWYQRELAIWPWLIPLIVVFLYIPLLIIQVRRDPYSTQLSNLAITIQILIWAFPVTLFLTLFRRTRIYGKGGLLGLCVFICVASMMLPAAASVKRNVQEQEVRKFVLKHNEIIEAVKRYEISYGSLPDSLASLDIEDLQEFGHWNDRSYVELHDGIRLTGRESNRIPAWTSGEEWLLVINVESGSANVLYFYVPSEQYPAELGRIGPWATNSRLGTE